MRVLLLLVSLVAVIATAMPDVPLRFNYVFTRANSYFPQAWRTGGERFPSDAAVIVVEAGIARPLAPEFDSSADFIVSWDAKRVLFSGRQKASDTWQIWEKDVNGGAARRVANCETNCMGPQYLPGDKVVYTRQVAEGTVIESISLKGGTAKPLTFGGGFLLTDDVLTDGRILLEGTLASVNGVPSRPDLFVIYPDGTGLEALRGDHLHARTGGRQISSGEIVFEDAGRLNRFGPDYKEQRDCGRPFGTMAPVADDGQGHWLFARPGPKGASLVFGKSPVQDAGPFNVQPSLIRVRPRPRDFPSGLLRSRPLAVALGVEMPAGARRVRVHFITAGEDYQAAVEQDGSFYMSLPGDEPIRFELLDERGQSLASEEEWVWLRKGEQRICTGCHAGPERVAQNRVPEALRRITHDAQ